MKHYKPLIFCCFFWMSTLTEASTLNISNGPLFLTVDVAPRTLIVMGRDHKLYYEAYNNASDLNGDGALDIRFDPLITYYGYFDSTKCYSYGSSKFSVSGDSTEELYECSGNWSGNFLNYVTTSRIDALRKVLYGGYRSTDSPTVTILERSYIPQDAHAWGIEYQSVATDGYNIASYTPYSAPSANNYLLIANVTLKDDGSQLPRMRVLPNVSYRIWEWVSIERPVAGNRVLNGGNGPDVSASIVDYIVRIEVCNSSNGLEGNCRLYGGGNYKPTGLLQDYGENNAMYFGILTGSYNKNLQGGVLRSPIGSITDEVDLSTGQFTNVDGVISTLNNLQFTLFGGNYIHDCNSGSSWITTRTINNGECRMWGNPIAEMMYEGLRYFAGKGSPTSSFNTSGGTDGNLGLISAVWDNPYASPTPWCAKPNMLVISDVNPSYDSDSIPGSYFSSFSGDLPGFNASSLANTIWSNEIGGSGNHFVGESQGDYDGAPSPKSVSSFGNIRGLSPEEPNKEGSYYAASAAYYGRINDISAALNDQLVYTFVVALSSPLPEININVGGQTVTLVPFAKSVGGCLGIDGTEGVFQPTNTIVDFYIESLSANTGVFRVNFEDVEQGADHDMDAIAKYTYSVSGNDVSIQVDSTYAAGCIIQHMGYVISGTTADGVYLVVRDDDTNAGSDFDYFLDTPNTGAELPLTDTRTFTAGSSSATFLKSPLYYAALYGGFNDLNDNDLPDQVSEYDADGDGNPDNYFLVTNALNLGSQLAAAFNKILERSGSFSSAALSSGFLTTDTKIYQAIFTTGSWKGQLLAFNIDPANGQILTNGSGPKGALWDAGTILSNMHWKNSRKIITYKPSTSTGIRFWFPSDPANPSATELDTDQFNELRKNPQTFTTQSVGKGKQRLRYLRGQRKKEQSNGGPFRTRDVVLGDNINANPLLVAVPGFQYPAFANGSESDYNAYKVAQANRTPVIYMGANDGMMHAFNATTGTELLAYVPSKVYSTLNQLTNPNYSHRYYVDGSPNAVDVFYGGSWHTVLASGLGAGGQGVFALDITDPNTFSEANAASIVKWEFTDLDDNDLGLTFSRPSIVRMADGQWAAVFGNGYNNTANDGHASTTGNAVLYIVNIETGVLIKKFDTEVGMAEDPLSLARPNGLATPSVIDINGDAVADYIYVGDLFGNLWKIDVSSTNTNQWDFALKQGNTPVPLFVAKDASNNPQPITGTITASRVGTAFNQFQIYFGTGKYIETGDNLDQSTQTFYAIRDDGSAAVTRTDLLEQTILSESGSHRVTSNTPFINNSHKGWYMDLQVGGVPLGERVISDPIYRQGKIIFTTIIPDSDPCEYGGTSWLMELDALGGSRLPFTPFDINDDGLFNNADLVTYTDDEGNSSQEVASGLKSEVGLVSTPVILNAGDKEYKYMPGSSGNVHTVGENPGVDVTGRQSWRQLK